MAGALDHGPRVTVGRIVHYTDRDQRVYPAMVIHVHNSDVVDLRVFTHAAIPVETGVVFDQERGPGTWRWPERV